MPSNITIPIPRSMAWVLASELGLTLAGAAGPVARSRESRDIDIRLVPFGSVREKCALMVRVQPCSEIVLRVTPGLGGLRPPARRPLPHRVGDGSRPSIPSH